MSHIDYRIVFPSLLFFCIVLTGCATIAGSREQSIYIDSMPNGATVTLNDVGAGVTPFRLTLLRKNPTAIIGIELEGFKPYVVELERKVNGWIWGNIILWGIIGMAIDRSTGAIFTYHLPESAETIETPEGGNHPKDVDLVISVVLELDPKLTATKVGQLVPN